MTYINTGCNGTYPKVAVRWLNQTLCFYPGLCLIDSEVIRNRHLRVAAKRYAMNCVGSMMCMFFTEQPVNDFKSALTSNTELYGKYFHEMLNRGVYLAPAQFEALFVSTAHTKNDLDKTIMAHKESVFTILDK